MPADSASNFGTLMLRKVAEIMRAFWVHSSVHPTRAQHASQRVVSSRKWQESGVLWNLGASAIGCVVEPVAAAAAAAVVVVAVLVVVVVAVVAVVVVNEY